MSAFVLFANYLSPLVPLASQVPFVTTRAWPRGPRNGPGARPKYGRDVLPSADDPAESTVEAVRDLVTALLDDAAVFPPGDATVPEAVVAHRAHRLAWYSDLVGPLLVRASQVADLLTATRPGDDLRVGVIADSGL